jgi:hypothetical protein
LINFNDILEPVFNISIKIEKKYSLRIHSVLYYNASKKNHHIKRGLAGMVHPYYIKSMNFETIDITLYVVSTHTTIVYTRILSGITLGENNPW